MSAYIVGIIIFPRAFFPDVQFLNTSSQRHALVRFRRGWGGGKRCYLPVSLQARRVSRFAIAGESAR